MVPNLVFKDVLSSQLGQQLNSLTLWAQLESKFRSNVLMLGSSLRGRKSIATQGAWRLEGCLADLEVFSNLNILEGLQIRELIRANWPLNLRLRSKMSRLLHAKSFQC